jgi:hypothetical protein
MREQNRPKQHKTIKPLISNRQRKKQNRKFFKDLNWPE